MHEVVDLAALALASLLDFFDSLLGMHHPGTEQS